MSTKSQNLKYYFAPVGAGVLAAALTFLPVTDKLGNAFDGIANAQDIQPVKHHREMTALEKDDAARRFSIHNEGVGVFVNFAAVPELAPERLIKAIEANFAKRGIPINLQTNLSKGDYTTVTFFVEGTPFGDMQSGHGYDLGELAQGFETVVRAYNQNQAKKAAIPAELHSAVVR